MTRKADAGFSLLEVLVVLALLATVSGATLISFRASAREDQPRTEATILASRLSLAADEALVEGDLLSLHLDATGYNVDRASAQGDEWTPDSSEMFGARHEVPEAIAMTVESGSERVQIRPDALGDRALVTFSNPDGAWRVSFDGLAAQAAPVER